MEGLTLYESLADHEHHALPQKIRACAGSVDAARYPSDQSHGGRVQRE